MQLNVLHYHPLIELVHISLIVRWSWPIYFVLVLSHCVSLGSASYGNLDATDFFQEFWFRFGWLLACPMCCIPFVAVIRTWAWERVLLLLSRLNRVLSSKIVSFCKRYRTSNRCVKCWSRLIRAGSNLLRLSVLLTFQSLLFSDSTKIFLNSPKFTYE